MKNIQAKTRFVWNIICVPFQGKEPEVLSKTCLLASALPQEEVGRLVIISQCAWAVDLHGTAIDEEPVWEWCILPNGSIFHRGNEMIMLGIGSPMGDKARWQLGLRRLTLVRNSYGSPTSNWSHPAWRSSKLKHPSTFHVKWDIQYFSATARNNHPPTNHSRTGMTPQSKSSHPSTTLPDLTLVSRVVGHPR